MPSTSDLRYAFNRGEIGKSALARIDRDGLRLAAETMVNWMPTQQGPMMLRPGSKYLGRTASDNAARLIPFVFSRDDTALLELTNNLLRVWVDDALVTRVSVSTAVTSGSFSSSSGWTLTATDGATATITGGVLTLAATARGSSASCTQTVSVASGDRSKEHALRIVVTRGPVFFQLGTSSGGDDLVKRTSLGTGTHSLAFTPGTGTTNIYIKFENKERPSRIVDSCTIEAAGVLTLPTIWGSSALSQLQYAPSGDVIFVAGGTDTAQQKIERRSTTSWSVVDYQSRGGPFRDPKPREQNIKMKLDGYEGNCNLIANAPIFKSTHVGALFRIFPEGQICQATLAGNGTWTPALRVRGVGVDRFFSYTITGTWSGTVILQRSVDGEDTGFTDVNTFTNTSNATRNVDDTAVYNNIVVWYRVGFDEPSGYTSGSATVAFGDVSSYPGPTSGGGKAAIVRVLSITSSTQAAVEVLEPCLVTQYTDNWMIGEFNAEDGYPTAVTLFDGRLWWAGEDRIWGSISDDYDNFDIDYEGDAGPISRSLGSGPVDTISWLMPLSRLLVGRGMAVSSIRSSDFNEPLTPTNFTIKDASTRGAAMLSPGQIDSRGIYIHANGQQLIETAYRVDIQDYNSSDLTMFNPEIGRESFTRLAVARSPDSRAFVVRGDGQLAVILREQDGDTQLASWWRIQRDDPYEDVAVLPDDEEDKIYVIVNTGSQRWLEVFAKRSECLGAPLTKCLDSHVVYSGSPTTTITGLSHLEGETVRVWGAASAGDSTGLDLGEYTVSSGQITGLPISVSVAVVGLPFTAQFLSAKLSYGAGLSFGSIKHIDQLAFILNDTHASGLLYGQDLDNLDPMPLIEEDEEVDADYIWPHYDKKITCLPGRWDTDIRLALQAESPKPVTVAAVMLSVDASARTN